MTWRHVPAEGHPGNYNYWFPDTHVRTASLDNFVGIIPAAVLEQMRHQAGSG